MTEKRLIQYKVLCDDYEEVRRILFEIIETGEEIEGYHQIQEWVDNLYKENEQLKQSIKEIDDVELHLKQIILKRIDDYIWEWEDEGTPVAQVLRELRDEIKGDI